MLYITDTTAPFLSVWCAYDKLETICPQPGAPDAFLKCRTKNGVVGKCNVLTWQAFTASCNGVVSTVGAKFGFKIVGASFIIISVCPSPTTARCGAGFGRGLNS